MSGPDASASRRWLHALKPGSWPKLLVPMLLGQSLGIAAAPRLSLSAVAVGVLFTVFDLVFIVLMNDWADRRVDAIKRRKFPKSGSPKSIPDGLIDARVMLVVGLTAGAIACALAVRGATLLGRPWLGVGGLACVAVFVAYSLPPARLNYRGGGEVLEALGVGAALPWFSAYAHASTLSSDAYGILSGFVALSFASAVASGLSDEESDRLGGKRTVVTLVGNATARRVVEGFVLVGVGVWVAFAVWRPSAVNVWVAVAASVVVLYHFVAVRRSSDSAAIHAFTEQKAYKLHLHRAIWRGAVVASCAAVVLELSGVG